MDINRKIFSIQQADGKKGKLDAIPSSIFINSELSDQANSLHSSHSNAHIICDKNTYHALGNKLISLTNFSHTILPSPVSPSIETVKYVQSISSTADVLIAVGSGTINDICKYASFLSQKKYIIWGTAASMNGYLSSNASIVSSDGAKTTVQAHLPSAAYFDMDVISHAPLRLSQAGLGDSMCRSTAQFDWLFSHLLLETPYDGSLFELLLDSEQRLITQAHTLHSNPTTFMIALMENLILSGISMFLAGGSYPASQAEHMLAHYIDTHFKATHESYHGEHIAVTAPIIAKYQHLITHNESPSVSSTLYTIDEFVKLFGKKRAEYYYSQYRQKYPDQSYLEHLNHKLKNEWSRYLVHLKPLALQSQKISDTLNQASCPIHPQDIAWKEVWVKEALNHAYLTRNRFTTLDLI